MKRFWHLSAAVAALLMVQGCQMPPKAPDARGPGASKALNSAEIGAWGFDMTAQDRNIRPGEDFNRYANGLWLDAFEIPADLSSYGLFTKLRLEAEEDIRAIVAELSASEAEKGSLEQKVGDFYDSWMDVERLNAKGSDPIRPHLAKIASIDSTDALMDAFASIHNTGPFGIGIIPDPADTTRYIAFVGQSGLGMPNRDYYLKEDESFVQYRQAYVAYIEKVLSLAGIANADQKAADILALETRLAEVHWTQADSRNIRKIYNPMSLEQLSALAPQVDWTRIMNRLQLDDVETFLVAQTTAIAASGEIVENTPLDLWKDYLSYHLIRSNAQYLSSDFDKANFEFFAKTLSGVEEQRERWKRGISQINGGMGEAVGQIYVQRHFPPGHKQAMDVLVQNLTEAFEERLQENVWMDDETRAQALVKLSTFEPRIGYTEKWTDYGPLTIKEGDLLGNAMALSEFQWQEQVNRLGGPVDRKIWSYPPQTVNASYSPLLNQITFPAGILQPPFFDPNADPAINYGAIGAVIGHEIGHGFDDQGRRFDEKGRIRDWWTEFANQEFSKRTERLGSQYATYEPIEGQFINPDLTMGENIGDLGGMQMAYAAYRRYLDQCCDGEAPVLDGYTGDQRFFLAWAQVWRAKYRDDAMRQRLLTAPHSPAAYRINGVVRNIDAWYDAFGVTEEDALYLPPEERVKIW